jgi:hypothetical protein
VALITVWDAVYCAQRPLRWPVRAGGQPPIGRDGKPFAVRLTPTEPRAQLTRVVEGQQSEGTVRRSRKERLGSASGDMAAAHDGSDGQLFNWLVPPSDPERNLPRRRADGIHHRVRKPDWGAVERRDDLDLTRPTARLPMRRGAPGVLLSRMTGGADSTPHEG